MKPAITELLSFFRNLLGNLRIIVVIFLTSLLLSGCVKYDVGVKFDSPNRGEFVQHIKLGEQLTHFSNTQAQEWLNSIESRAKQLEGKTKRLSNQEIVVTIPFDNGAQLESKFDKFFNPVVKKVSPAEDVPKLELPTLNSKFRLEQNNAFLWERNHLSYDLDLQSLGVLSTNGTVIVSPGSLLELQFSLQTPWGAKSIENAENAISPNVYDNGHQLVWTLKPGQLNHVEAVFWMPSSIGIGSILIVLLVLAGYYVKYKTLPGKTTRPIAPVAMSKV
ncbi:MAG: DUF3153 domain-containing protein [Potamolinea sp.]